MTGPLTPTVLVPRTDVGNGSGAGGTGISSQSQSLDLESLLAKIQGGFAATSDANVTFLCQKFSLLMERMQRAEDGEAEAEGACVRLSEELRVLREEEEAERRGTKMISEAAIEETRALEASISEAAQGEAAAAERSEVMRRQAEALACRREELDQRCATEHAQMVESSTSRLRQSRLRAEAETERQRLQAQTDTLTTRCKTKSAELLRARTQASRDEARIAQLKTEAQGEEEAREHASERVSAHRGDLEDALASLALLKERLTEVQVGIQQCDDQLRRQSGWKRDLSAELQRRDAWMASAAQEQGSLLDAELGLERVLADTAEIRAQTNLEEMEARKVQAANESQEALLADLQRRLKEEQTQFQEVEQRQAQVRQQAAHAAEERVQMELSLDRLTHDEVTDSGVRRSLGKELQELASEAEALRLEVASRLAERSEVQRRLQLVTPALTEARRKVRELEEKLEAARTTFTREQQLGERLEHETLVCQDRIEALRNENVRLSGQCIELEAESEKARWLRARSSSGAGMGREGVARRSMSNAPAVVSGRSRRPPGNSRAFATGLTASASGTTSITPRCARGSGIAAGERGANSRTGSSPPVFPRRLPAPPTPCTPGIDTRTGGRWITVEAATPVTPLLIGR